MSQYKGYRISIVKDSNENLQRNPNEVVDVNTNEFSFNPNGSTSSQNAANSQKVNNVKGGAVNTALVNMGKQAINYGLQNYGELTGDYQTQANIQSFVEIGRMVATVAIGGPVGAIAVAGELAFKAINQQIDLAKKRQETQLLRERTGVSAYNGGR